jgi:sec-independent protein translocase protein TatA
MGSLSALHWLVVGLIVVLLFGTKKLPELGSGLGQAISNFRKSFKENNTIDVSPDKEDKDQAKK